MNTTAPQLNFVSHTHTLQCVGDWTLSHEHTLATFFPRITRTLSTCSLKTIYLDGSQLTHLDSIGIWWLEKLLSLCKTQHIHCQLKHFSPSHTELIELLIEKLRESHAAPPSPSTSWVTQLGQTTLSLIEESLGLISFVGKVTFVFFYLLRHPHQIQWRNFFNSVQKTGFDALPITGLLSFLIGIVLAYQMGIQLRNYGANIFVVDLMGLSVLREFAPMMTAIILAGRSGSAFAAQIGTMKLNQEVDALRTLGIRPIERLVMPKLFALSLTLPLLTVWADMLGILGGMVMAKSTLNINFVYFLHRFSQVVPFKWYFIGLIKAPVFAAIIANIGCYQGLCVESNADSVGAHTTKSVVQAIFMIITFDAFFSILLSWLKI